MRENMAEDDQILFDEFCTNYFGTFNSQMSTSGGHVRRIVE